MSELRGLLTPEARATLEAVLAKLAAPGMCNPLDETPCVGGAPTQEAIERDPRSASQRNHDGLLAALRGVLTSGELAQHNGLPASIIVTTTLQELEAAAGRGLTGGGTILPMSDVIRLAPQPITTWPSSTKAKRWPFITPNGSPHPDSESSCTPRIVAALRPDARCPAITAKSTTSPTTARATPPTSTNSPSRAGLITGCCNPAAGPPAKTTRATPNGSRRPGSIAAGPAPTPCTIPSDFCAARTNSGRRHDRVRAAAANYASQPRCPTRSRTRATLSRRWSPSTGSSAARSRRSGRGATTRGRAVARPVW